MISKYENALPMEWGHAHQIPNYDWYLATDKGLIISTRYKKPRTLSPSIKKNKRMTVNLWSNGEHRTEYVHRLVALTFHGQPKPGQEVNHIDGNPQNNKPENLEWCTRSYNQQHAFRTGLNSGRKGSMNNKTKLTDADVMDIKLMIGTSPTLRSIAEKYGISLSAIKHIKQGRTWKHLADDPIAYLGANI